MNPKNGGISDKRPTSENKNRRVFLTCLYVIGLIVNLFTMYFWHSSFDKIGTHAWRSFRNCTNAGSMKNRRYRQGKFETKTRPVSARQSQTDIDTTNFKSNRLAEDYLPLPQLFLLILLFARAGGTVGAALAAAAGTLPLLLSLNHGKHRCYHQKSYDRYYNIINHTFTPISLK